MTWKGAGLCPSSTEKPPGQRTVASGPVEAWTCRSGPLCQSQAWRPLLAPRSRFPGQSPQGPTQNSPQSGKARAGGEGHVSVKAALCPRASARVLPGPVCGWLLKAATGQKLSVPKETGVVGEVCARRGSVPVAPQATEVCSVRKINKIGLPERAKPRVETSRVFRRTSWVEGETDPLGPCSLALLTRVMPEAVTSLLASLSTGHLTCRAGGLEFAQNRVMMLRPKQRSLFGFLLTWHTFLWKGRVPAGLPVGKTAPEPCARF